MAGFTGTATTYDLTVGVKLDMEDAIYLLDPFDVPLLGTFGSDGRSVLSKGTAFEKKVEWMDETLLTPRSLAGAAATTSEGVLTVASGEQHQFQTGDVLLIRSEYLRVTGYGSTADTLLVTRGFGDSSGASIASSDVIVGLGQALPEGSNPENERAKDRTARYNVTQIFGPIAIKVSGTEQAVRKYGVTNEFDHQVGQRTKEMWIAMEQAVLYGQREESSGDEWRTMGGFTHYITVNKDTTTTDITEAAFLDLAQDVYDAGGKVDRATLGATQKRKVSALNSSAIQLGRQDNGRGQVVDYIDSDFGRIDLLLNRWCRSSDIFLYSRDQVTVETLRPLQFMPLALTGDSVRGQLVAEKTLRFRGDRHAARFTALT